MNRRLPLDDALALPRFATGAAVALALCLGTPGRVILAQDVSGHVALRVATAAGDAVGDAIATVSGTGTPVRRIALSDEAGRVRLLGLPSGRYDITVARIGYRPQVVRDVLVISGRTTDAGEIRLQPQPAALDTIIVTADRVSFDPRSTAVGATIGATAFGDLPTGRSYLSVVTLLPQANESFYGDGLNIAGRTGLENAIYIDGINVTEPYKGAGGLALPFNFIAEVQLRTGGYEAEYGRALGGVVNVVTRSGGNTFRASSFGFYTGSSLSGDARRGFLDLRSGGFRRYDIGASLAGPVVRDRAWFFAAYDAAYGAEDVSLPTFGTRSDRTRTGHFAGKLTWQPALQTTLDLSVVGDPTSRDVVGNTFFLPIFQPDSLANIDPFLGRSRQGGWALSLNARRAAGRATLLEASFSRLDTRTRDEPATARGRSEALTVAFGASGQTWSGGYGNFFDHHSVRTAGSLALTHHRGEHSVKLGVQYEDNLLDEDWRWLGDAPHDGSIVIGAPPVAYTVLVLDFRTRVHNRIASAFVQGSLRLGPRVRLNPGVRWDGQYLSGERGVSGAIADQWQPRVGLVVYPGVGERRKLTASFARYYEQLSGLPTSFFFGPLEQVYYNYAPDTAGNTQETTTWQINRPLDRIEGQHYDEVTLGYEAVERRVTLAARLVYRVLRQIITTLYMSPDTVYAGNPADYPDLPRPRGDYAALEVSLSTRERANPRASVSYVLSRSRGNYVGLYDTDAGVGNPHSGSNYTNPLELENAYGLLPNDRPHVAKVSGAYRFRFGLTAGAFLSLQSGTPLNEFGANRTSVFDRVFLRPRGAAGRTPTLWNLDLHLAYELQRLALARGRLLLDALHVFSPRKAVYLNQDRYLAVDASGNQTTPNPNYLRPIAYQPPTTVRLGFQVDF